MAEWQNCCRGRRSNCPHVQIDGRTVRIKDDAGDVIEMTIDQFQDVYFKVVEIVSQRSAKAPMGLIP